MGRPGAPEALLVPKRVPQGHVLNIIWSISAPFWRPFGNREETFWHHFGVLFGGAFPGAFFHDLGSILVGFGERFW